MTQISQRKFVSHTVWLTAAAILVGGCFESGRYLPTAPETQDALVVSGSQTSVPADGVSTVTITARVDPAVKAEYRTLVFESSDGTFVESSAAPHTQVERTVGSDGTVAATLRSSRNVGPVEVTVKVKDLVSVFARLSLSFTAADPDSSIQLTTATPTAPADGMTLTAITAMIDAELPSGRRNVSFTTSRGTFSQSGNATAMMEAMADHKARVDLKSPTTPGVARLTATVDGVTTERTFEFVAALPDTILVSVTNPIVEATNEAAGSTSVEVQLLRSVGVVSDQTPITVVVLEAGSGASIPVLLGGLGPADATGKETFTITVGPVTYRGRATVQVGVPGTSVSGSTTIEIVSPT